MGDTMPRGRQQAGRPPGFRPLRSSDPTLLGEWRLTGRLGAGGMGNTYLATGSDGTWAVAKVLREDLADDPAFRLRFGRELSVLRRLDATYTAAVLDADLDDERPYIIIEYLSGPTLGEQVSRYGSLSDAAVRTLALDMARALRTVHDVGVAHRDIKPANVILGRDHARLIDFGIAQAHDATSLTRTGLVVGSPGWLAPEQVTGAGIGPPADIFGWASVVTFAATGVPPFGEGGPEQIFFRILNEAPDLDGVPSDLHGLLAAALQREPGARPSAAECVRLLSGDSPDVAAGVPTDVGVPGSATEVEDAGEPTDVGTRAAVAGSVPTQGTPTDVVGGGVPTDVSTRVVAPPPDATTSLPRQSAARPKPRRRRLRRALLAVAMLLTLGVVVASVGYYYTTLGPLTVTASYRFDTLDKGDCYVGQIEARAYDAANGDLLTTAITGPGEYLATDQTCRYSTQVDLPGDVDGWEFTWALPGEIDSESFAFWRQERAGTADGDLLILAGSFEESPQAYLDSL